MARAYPGIVAAMLFLATAAVNLEVPLYRAYAERAGYGTGPTAVVFAAYVGGLLPVLIVCGGISDRVGRKPVVLAGLAAAALATALMIARPTMEMLLVARLLQGVGVGLSVGAGTAYLAELLGGAQGPTRAAATVAFTTSLGFGGGALATTIALALLPGDAATPRSYPLLLLATVVCLAVALALPATTPPGGPLLRLPSYPAGTVPLGLTIAVAWAVTGLVIAVVPTQLARAGLGGWVGAALFCVNGTGALCQPLARRLSPGRALRVGCALVPSGYLILVVGAWRGWLPLVLAGAALAGAACYGFTYLGGLAAVSRAGGAERARAVSGYFLWAYLGFGLPSVALGFLADRVGVLPALVGFGIVVVLASGALASRVEGAGGVGGTGG